jgi:uncharacterized membrane protein YeaQ/YmgE (transglycosylase-associated protein family)
MERLDVILSMDNSRAHFRFHRQQDCQQIRPRRCNGHIILGIVGAIAGGWLFNTMGHMGVTGVNLYSILVAVVGAVIVLFIYHALVGKRGHA